MSSAIMSLLISHILTFVESELLKEEPELMAVLTQDVQSLISKLEALISGKSTAVAKVVNPVLDVTSKVVTDAISAAGASVANDTGANNAA
jgi:hypothetical protein